MIVALEVRDVVVAQAGDRARISCRVSRSPGTSCEVAVRPLGRRMVGATAETTGAPKAASATATAPQRSAPRSPAQGRQRRDIGGVAAGPDQGVIPTAPAKDSLSEV